MNILNCKVNNYKKHVILLCHSYIVCFIIRRATRQVKELVSNPFVYFTQKMYVQIKSNQSNQVVSVPFCVVQKILKIKFKRINSIGIEMKKKHVHCKFFETN